MTKELAIQILRGEVLGTNEQTHEAVFMAIKALKNEQKQGEWIKNEGRYGWHCSVCEKDDFYAFVQDSDTNENKLQDYYCPNCGARMVRDEK